MQPVPKRESNLRLRSAGVSPAALRCGADACVGTPGPEWCGKVPQSRCTQTRESSAAGAQPGLGELHAKKKKTKGQMLQSPGGPCWSSAEEELLWYQWKMMDFSGNSSRQGWSTHHSLPPTVSGACDGSRPVHADLCQLLQQLSLPGQFEEKTAALPHTAPSGQKLLLQDERTES